MANKCTTRSSTAEAYVERSSGVKLEHYPTLPLPGNLRGFLRPMGKAQEQRNMTKDSFLRGVQHGSTTKSRLAIVQMSSYSHHCAFP